MVADNDMGPGKFVPISEEGRRLYALALAAGQEITLRDKAQILKVAEEHPEWDTLALEPHALEVHTELGLQGKAFGLLAVQSVMADWHAGVR
jgi:hypothetical protein